MRHLLFLLLCLFGFFATGQGITDKPATETQIFILTIWDTRQNPDKLEKILR